MPTLKQLQQQTMPVTVPISPTETLTLHVYTQKTTRAGRRELHRLMHQTDAVLQQTAQAATALTRQKQTLLEPIAALIARKGDSLLKLQNSTDEAEREGVRGQIADIEREIEEAGSRTEGTLIELDERFREVGTQGEEAQHDALARQLEFFVASTDLTDDDGQPLSASYELFRDEFSFQLAQEAVAAIVTVMGGPLVTGDSGGGTASG